ncbi:hypothetical protein A2881_04995 [Candidatus Peribacteria bacterium RIFCSPHIGHO2_01_FULL_55_13]|nr:MAG: hypothetical protein A2881_04995 [Candidatus Peribacteria bacterium RIFCSPHIGHO2_01_FULL_55_13]OGJ64256.1 MAG: hypothetical protein A3F36_02500 [Candidatus Peribacteria bacterium RIFCSPHIGHO2_12_FULL_55_11]
MLRAFLALTASLLASLQLSAAVIKGPPTYLTRAEAAMLLLTSADIPLIMDREPLLYPDVLEDEWYVPYLKTAVRMEMIDPNAQHGLLQPHHSVNRAEFLKMMTIAYGLPKNLPYPYTDIPADAWYRTYAGIAQVKGVFRDYKEPLLLHPESRVTQEEAVATIGEVLKGTEQVQIHPGNQLRQALTAPDRSQPVPTVNVQATPYAISPLMVKESILRQLSNKSNTLDDVRLLILQRVNEERRAAGIHILRHNALLATAAQDYAKDMSKRGFFSHFSPEGLSYVDRIRAAGYIDSSTKACPCTPSLNTMNLLQNRREIGSNYILMKSGDQCECQARFSLGENIAKGQLTPTQVMNDWMQSENHRRNILSGAFDEIGIGIFGDVWVQEFGKLETQ